MGGRRLVETPLVETLKTVKKKNNSSDAQLPPAPDS
jgi:hypothetical protein